MPTGPIYLMDSPTPGMPITPLDWLKRLEVKLDEQAKRCALYETYYEGMQSQGIVMMSTIRYQEYFMNMIRTIQDNWLPIVVDAVDERLSVQGFRMDPSSAGVDNDIWKIWQYNNFDLASKMLFTSALTCGIAFVMVWHSGDDARPVRLTAEHGREVYVAVDYETGFRIAAIKKWCDEWTGEERANVYRPEAIYKYVKRKGSTDWTPEALVPNPLGVVPIIPVRNRTNLRADSWASEIKDVMSTQDQINKLVTDMLIASEFGAFRQRWATGLDIPIDNATGKPAEIFKSALDRLWSTGDPSVTFGEFSATDLGNFVKALENRIQSLASRSRTPSHYLLGSTTTVPSGESLKTEETGLIAKVRRHWLEYGDPLEEMARLAFAVTGDPRSKAYGAEVLWGDPESRTESEHVDATVKKLALGVPMEQLWLDVGYSPLQIEQFWIMAAKEKEMRAKLGVESPPAANGGQPDNNGAPGTDQLAAST